MFCMCDMEEKENEWWVCSFVKSIKTLVLQENLGWWTKHVMYETMNSLEFCECIYMSTTLHEITKRKQVELFTYIAWAMKCFITWWCSLLDLYIF